MGGAQSALEAQQRKLGAQSRRGAPVEGPMHLLKDDPYALARFAEFFANEDRFCAQHGVFYHSYSHAALLYEVRAAAATALGLAPRRGAASASAPRGAPRGAPPAPPPLPRLLEEDFRGVADAATLMRRVREDWGPTKSDHDPAFRRVGVSAMCSLLARGPECCMQVAFSVGYSCQSVAFRDVLEEELRRAFGASTEVARDHLPAILALAEEHNLDVSIFGGSASRSGHAGHILQIFVRRDLLDQLCYPALPYGEIDETRLPFSAWMNGSQDFSWGQARLLAHPRYFLEPKQVRLFTVSADAAFQAGRSSFQAHLTALLRGLAGLAASSQRRRPRSVSDEVAAALRPGGA